MRSTDIWRQYS